MPRLTRLDSPGILHHVMIRGIERKKIFRDNKDRDNFIDRLSVLIPETKTICYAWAFMPNHAHFLFRSGPPGISTLMRRLLTGYAVTFNRRHRRHGQLFQNRYKSILCQEDTYLRELVRYIHLNPLRAKIVTDMDDLKRYAYCGHSALMGKKKREWQDVDYVLGFFGKNTRSARRNYSLYIEKGVNMGRRPELVGGGLIRSLGGWDEIKKLRLKGQDRIKSDERILGDSDFVNGTLTEVEDHYTRQQQFKMKGITFEKVLDRVSSIYDLDKRYILGKGRQKDRVESRDLVCYWAAHELGISITALARKFRMTVPGAGYAVKRGEVITNQNEYQLFEEDS
jgi:putative transposase